MEDKMKAIVLSFDRYRPLADHMIFKYEEIWTQHPFKFRIPYQDANLNHLQNCEYIKSPADIKSTVLALLSGLGDEEWIYWCIDDKYPIRLELSRIQQITSWIHELSPQQCSGVLFCRCRSTLDGKALRQETLNDSSNHIYLRRKDYSQIWIHQFLRVKVLRHLFNHFPNEIPNAKAMDDFKKKVILPESHRLFVTDQNLAVFGESTSRGMLTSNCHQSIWENGLTLPDIPVDNKTIVMGALQN
jgi:hypothetical protein